MATLQIPGRPFASEQITGLALPDGIFEIAFGQLTINAHFQNTDRATATTATVYLEGASDPGIAIVPATQRITGLPAGGARLLRWRADFTRATPGKALLSFVCIDASGTKTRILQPIFVTRTTFDARSNTVAIQTPEGVLRASFPLVVRPIEDGCCATGVGGVSGSGTGGGLGGGGGTGTGGGGGGPSGCGPGCSCGTAGCPCVIAPRRPLSSFRSETDLMSSMLQAAVGGQNLLRPTWYLPEGLRCAWEPTPPFAGPYGDLPFQDPWWKVLLSVVAVTLVMASTVVSGPMVGTGEPSETGPEPPGQRSCAVTVGGPGASHVATGLIAAAAASVLETGLGDTSDPFRRGQDRTRPGPDERTIAENLLAELALPEAVVLGKPFEVGARWKYQRITTDREYPYAASDVHRNVHVLSKYEIAAPEVNRAYAEEAWIARARFWDARGKLMTGTELFVQCFLIGPCSQVIRVLMQDDGVAPDATAGDGTYTALHRFTREAEGVWKYLVIAQDVNTARPDLPPEQAARIVGGIVRTHQLTISLGTGTCRLIPDGYIHVIGGLT